MRRGIFHKYLLGFTSFFLVPMVVLSICLQIIMYRNLSREILGYNENILERLGDDLVTMNGRLMAVSYTHLPLGDIFLNLMFTIVVPMVFVSISSAVGNMVNMKRLGKILSSLVMVFVITGAIAGVLVLVVVRCV